MYYGTSSNLYGYVTHTYNSDGTIAKDEQYINNNLDMIETYSYDANKKPKSATITVPGSDCDLNFEYTFQNGRKTQQVMNNICGTYYIQKTQWNHTYDSNGRRTKINETFSASINGNSQTDQREITRTYNSDGTIQKITYPQYVTHRTITHTFTWENGKTTFNYDDFSAY